MLTSVGSVILRILFTKMSLLDVFLKDLSPNRNEGLKIKK